MSINTESITDFLVEIGIKGRLVEILTATFESSEDLEKFKLFIIKNDGKYKSNAQLVHQYILSLQEENRYSKDEFVSEYSRGDKENALSRLMLTDINSTVLNKVEKILENGLTCESLYDKLVEYRKSYSVSQAVNLISLHMEICIKELKKNA